MKMIAYEMVPGVLLLYGIALHHLSPHPVYPSRLPWKDIRNKVNSKGYLMTTCEK